MNPVHCLLACLAVLLSFSFACADDVAVRLDAEKTHQIFEGFGATTTALTGAHGNPLGPALRAKVLDAVYGQVKLTMGNLNVGPLESPGGWGRLRNDNDDPRVINRAGFDFEQMEHIRTEVVDPAAPLGFDHWTLAGNVSWRWAAPWMGKLYQEDRDRALDEAAEKVLVAVMQWKELTGKAPGLVHLFNEPTSGNREMIGADAAGVRDTVKRVGARLAEAGFGEVRFVVPNEETVRHSIDVAKVILEDPEARKYVAAIGYHCYPYGSPYASVPKILAASGAGKPDRRSITERVQLRDLCRKYGLQAWMTEVSHSEVDPRSFDHLRGRAIHIHDEMLYADASAVYGMNAFGDKKTHLEHFAGRLQSNPWLIGSDQIAEAENDEGAVIITGMGYAMGHYARWLTRGAVRIEASSADPLVQVSAFRDGARKRLVLVVVNNNDKPVTLAVSLAGLTVAGQVEGEESTADARWQRLKPTPVEGADGLKHDLAALSVTTLSAPLAAARP